MANESGDTKLLGNFSKLIELISIDPNYNPANAKIKLPALTAQKAAALAAVGNVGTNEASFKAVTNERQGAYEDLPGIMTRSGNMLKALGAGKKIIDDAKSVSRKVLGRRKTAIVKDDPKTPANEATKSHSASQLSFENRSGNFNDYIDIVAIEPSYEPNEPELKITGLRATSQNLSAKNDAVNAAFASMSAARGQRDELLYLSDDSVVNTALLVKAYVRAALGPDSPTFKSIKGLEFSRQGKKSRA
jgi:hypothetical protein